MLGSACGVVGDATYLAVGAIDCDGAHAEEREGEQDDRGDDRRIDEHSHAKYERHDAQLPKVVACEPSPREQRGGM